MGRTVDHNLPRDASGAVLFDPDWWLQAQKSMTFDGATVNDPGDYTGGTGNPATLFTVTGLVLVKLLAYCTTDLAGGSSTLIVGTTLDTDALIAVTTCTNIVKGEIFHDNSPDIDIEASTIASEFVMCGTDSNILQTAGVANITAGTLEYVCCWFPLSSDGDVCAAS